MGLRRFFLALLFGVGLQAQAAPVEVSFARFFGSCEAEFGSSVDPSQASGECGIITALINKFNAQNSGRIVVRPQVIEHSAYYSQLGARIVGRDLPTLVVMHSSILNDFAKRRLLEPLDQGFRAVGIDTADFTPQAERAVSIGPAPSAIHYALPFDTHSWLWHCNLRLLGQAGLLGADGQALLPHSPEELLRQARQFKARTGKPYFIWLTVNDPAFMSRTLLTLVQQQGGTLFPRRKVEIDLHSKDVRAALALMQQLFDEGLVSRGHDYGGGVQAFLRGEGGVMVNGTWLIGDLVKQSLQAGSPLFNSYSATPFPQIYSQPSVWADNHVLAMLSDPKRDAATTHAALVFLKFLFDEGGAWARTGQLPTRRTVIDSPAYLALPMRSAIASISRDGAGLPLAVARQTRVVAALGEQLSAIIVYGAPVDATLNSLERNLSLMLRRESQFNGSP